MQKLFLSVLVLLFVCSKAAQAQPNFLKNADLATVDEAGLPVVWEISGKIQPGQQDGQPVVLLDARTAQCRMEQFVKMPANQLCRLSAEFKGTVGGRLRNKSRTGVTEDLWFEASTNWTRHEISFITTKAEPWFIIIDTPESGTGELSIRGLTLVGEPTAKVAGPAIPVPVNTSRPYVVQHVPVADCRAVRGFFGAPIDGTPESTDYSGRRWEYNHQGEQANAAVRYLYRHNDGLHVELADHGGVDAIQIYGGVKADVVANCRQYDDPTSGQAIYSFPGGALNSMACFSQRVRASRFSFFNVRDGEIADLYFFRCDAAATMRGTPETSTIGGTADTTPLGQYFTERFEPGQRTALSAFRCTDAQGKPLNLQSTNAMHIVVGPFDSDRGLAGIGLQGVIGGVTGAVPLTVQVQDFVNPRTAITTAMLQLAGPGKLDLALGIPNQVLPKGSLLWVTLMPGTAFTLASPQLVLYGLSREEATPGALAYRLTKLKSFWSIMSEERPWNPMHRDSVVSDFFAAIEPEFARLRTIEIRDAIEYCFGLNPDEPAVAQYHSWFYRGKYPPRLAPPEFELDPVVPDWANVVHAAWLAARSVPDWWVTHRLVPSGEFGGSDDDGSMYQNFANFPMFESDGVGAKLKDGAAHRAELDQKVRLYQGLGRTTEDPLHFYEDGLNQESLVTWWHYGDPVYIERCMQTAKSLETLTMINAAGHRHFKGGIMGAVFLHDTNQPVEFDSGFSAQVVHPVCELVLYNHNPRALKFLRELGDAWVDHVTHDGGTDASAAEGDKKELGQLNEDTGQYTMGVDVASDKAIDSSTEPYSGGFGNHASMMAFLTRVTGDAKYIQPLIDYYTKGEYAEGTVNYLSDFYQMGWMDNRPDASRRQLQYSPVLEWLATGNRRPFMDVLRTDISEMATFPYMYTAAEPFTDRIFLYAAINPTLAYTGGFATRNKTFHSHAVSWEGFGTDYAALVRGGRPNRFSALLYNFTGAPLHGAMRLWTLEHGRYEMAMGIDTNDDDMADSALPSREVEVVRGDAIPLELLPRKVTMITFTQKQKLDPVETRPDLALSPLELTVANGVVAGVAHNIGSTDVADVNVALVDDQGRVQQQKSLGALPAPADLTPQRKAFQFEKLPEPHAGWRVVLDNAEAIAEVTEVNNAIVVP